MVRTRIKFRFTRPAGAVVRDLLLSRRDRRLHQLLDLARVADLLQAAFFDDLVGRTFTVPH
ncbi:MAG TPA: hypothetical protein VEB41_04610, partial [Burkholderiales bacterium]|nr:hypothetical protein [Burkholderiales bacterium]